MNCEVEKTDCGPKRGIETNWGEKDMGLIQELRCAPKKRCKEKNRMRGKK